LLALTVVLAAAVSASFLIHTMTNNQRLAKASPINLGQHVPLMETIAQRHATAMSKSGIMDHTGWPTREAELYERVRGYGFGEVVAMAWNVTRDQAIALMWQKWQESRPHWRILNSGNLYGLALAESDKGFFGCGLIGTAK
jgi:hypothetical protein